MFVVIVVYFVIDSFKDVFQEIFQKFIKFYFSFLFYFLFFISRNKLKFKVLIQFSSNKITTNIYPLNKLTKKNKEKQEIIL